MEISRFTKNATHLQVEGAIKWLLYGDDIRFYVFFLCERLYRELAMTDVD